MANVILVAGLTYGDEGKGSTIDYLARNSESPVTVVRYNGGAQAAHNVVTPDGRHHLFAQFGSGTLAGAQTHLSRHMLVNPLFLLSEEAHLLEVGVTDGFRRMTVEREALITNPFQVSANRLREMARNNGRHGSCGMGIGETVADFVERGEEATIRIKDLEDPVTLRRKLIDSQRYKARQMLTAYEALPKEDFVEQEWRILIDGTLIDHLVNKYRWFATGVTLVDSDWLQTTLNEPGTVLFEGAQGVLLDQDFGTFPFVTRSRCTYANALDLLGDFQGSVRRLGLLRSYMTRHGAGPFVTEDTEVKHPELHNCYGPWQEGWRQGHLDLVALDYAIRAIGGVDEIVVSHMDYIDGPQQVCIAYEGFTWELPTTTVEKDRLAELQRASEGLSRAQPVYASARSGEALLAEIERAAGAPITFVSHGPTAEDTHAYRPQVPTHAWNDDGVVGCEATA